MPNTLPVSDHDRRDERVHLFLVATLYAGSASMPVRVRNLSAHGALIEGGTLPPAGSAIRLKRGHLEASGRIMWATAGRAGVSLTGSVAVAAWIPTKEGKAQSEVDRMAYAVRSGASADIVGPIVVPTATDRVGTALSDLVKLQSDLQRLADMLADDAVIVATHPEVQFLDAAGQRIGRIIAAFRDDQTVRSTAGR